MNQYSTEPEYTLETPSVKITPRWVLSKASILNLAMVGDDLEELSRELTKLVNSLEKDLVLVRELSLRVLREDS